MKTLKFENKLAELILSGEKDCTWRIFDDKDLQIDDELILINRDTKEEFGKAKIVSLREKKLGDMNDVDLEGHEKFQSNEEMVETYKGYYGDEVSGDSMVKIIKFQLL